MGEDVDDGNAGKADREGAAKDDAVEALFGAFSVVGAGVQIILQGRPFSAPAAD